MKKKLITTPILDSHGKIGPFFMGEAIAVSLILFFLSFSVILFDAFYPISFFWLLIIPGSFLGLLTIIRSFFIKRITSPYYMQNWIARSFIWPKSILANAFSFKRQNGKQK